MIKLYREQKEAIPPAHGAGGIFLEKMKCLFTFGSAPHYYYMNLQVQKKNKGVKHNDRL